MRQTLTACLLLLITSPVLADEVGVRVLDTDSGEEVAADTIAIDERLAIPTADGERYLGFALSQLRGRALLQKSLADSPEAWEAIGYTGWNQPSRHQLSAADRVLEVEPVGWAERFCAEFEALDEIAERESRVSVHFEDARLVNPPGWNGRDEIALADIARPDADAEWSVYVDREDALVLAGPDDAEAVMIDSVRAEYPAVRAQTVAGQALTLEYVPANYGGRFCQQYAEAGEAWAAEIGDYFFGSR